jgi:hypothetical protein
MMALPVLLPFDSTGAYLSEAGAVHCEADHEPTIWSAPPYHWSRKPAPGSPFANDVFPSKIRE